MYILIYITHFTAQLSPVHHTDSGTSLELTGDETGYANSTQTTLTHRQTAYSSWVPQQMRTAAVAVNIITMYSQ